MAGTLRSRNRRNIDDTMEETPTIKAPVIEALGEPSATSDIEIYAKEVLHSLIADNLPPTPKEVNKKNETNNSRIPR